MKDAVAIHEGLLDCMKDHLDIEEPVSPIQTNYIKEEEVEMPIFTNKLKTVSQANNLIPDKSICNVIIHNEEEIIQKENKFTLTEDEKVVSKIAGHEGTEYPVQWAESNNPEDVILKMKSDFDMLDKFHEFESSHREQQTMYYCQHCDMKSKYKNNVENHERTVHLTEEEKCDIYMETMTHINTENLEADKILGKRKEDNFTEYLVKWKGSHQNEDNTWERKETLECKDKIEEYEAFKRDRKVVFSCKHCDMKSNNKSIIAQHERGVHDGIKYKCNICEYSTAQSFHLMRHKQLEHEGNSAHDLKEVSHNGLGKICRICDAKEKMPNTRQHYRKYHLVSSLDRYPCTVCWEWFNTEIDMMDHMIYHRENPKQLYCNICPHRCSAKFSNKIYRSMQTKDGTRIPVGQQSMREHLKEHDVVPQCDLCGKSLKHRQALKSHIEYVHMKDKHHTCNQCGRMFQLENRMREHIITYHTVQTNLNFNCQKCDKIYETKHQLKNHQSFHRPKSYTCEVCALTFRDKTMLKRHLMALHTKEKPFICTFEGCDKRFSRKLYLTRHDLIHTGQKPYNCDQCGARFNKQAHKRRHTLLHTGEKPHVCPNCGKGFIQKTNQRLHIIKCQSL